MKEPNECSCPLAQYSTSQKPFLQNRGSCPFLPEHSLLSPVLPRRRRAFETEASTLEWDDSVFEKQDENASNREQGLCLSKDVLISFIYVYEKYKQHKKVGQFIIFHAYGKIYPINKLFMMFSTDTKMCFSWEKWKLKLDKPYDIKNVK